MHVIGFEKTIAPDYGIPIMRQDVRTGAAGLFVASEDLSVNADSENPLEEIKFSNIALLNDDLEWNAYDVQTTYNVDGTFTHVFTGTLSDFDNIRIRGSNVSVDGLGQGNLILESKSTFQ